MTVVVFLLAIAGSLVFAFTMNWWFMVGSTAMIILGTWLLYQAGVFGR